MLDTPHIPVLYREVVSAYEGCEGIVIDCTMGYGGHSSLLLDTYPKITVIGIDQDQTAIDFSTERLEKYGNRMVIKKGRFSDVIEEIFQEYDVTDICGILADIGVSSLQLDQRERGFSFESDVLDMRMNPEASLSAADVINTYDQKSLEDILYQYGELHNSRKLASVILANRPFSSAKALADCIKPFMPKGKKIHPATLLMQAIRIEVNDELGELQALLDAIEAEKELTCKVGIISFHSLEDRIVKQRFTAWSKKCICPPEFMRCECGNNNARGKIITKKPLTAQADELRANARSRSAKLRVFKRDVYE
ncbi:MAG: 16S rRNA (cytosine(1402)-N(4))-methyltransferase RsmH [Campylobacterota bacterium]|nr:16S rRNA (cytosine(1402)-N(4))-methyltransferase RsmH [Campylobacterota bacterium]